MMTTDQIIRSIESGNYRLLVDRLLSNGRCHSRRAQAALRTAESQMPAAIGLGLQRTCELAYWPLPSGADLAHQLLRLQRRDGLFGPPHSVSQQDQLIAGSAVALRGLIEWTTAFAHREDERLLLHSAIDRGSAAIAASFINSKSESGDDATWAVVLWQLGDCDLACERLPMRKIRQHVAASSPELLRDDLTRLALTMAA